MSIGNNGVHQFGLIPRKMGNGL